MSLTFSGINGLTNFKSFRPLRPGASQKWTLAIIPDTQRLTGLGYNDEFVAMCQYIADTATAKNTKAVMHVGDVTNGYGSTAHYALAKTGTDILKSSDLAYNICMGNHDYDGDMKNGSRASTHHNAYYPVSDFSAKSWYGGVYESTKSENIYSKLDIFGQKWLFFALEFYPRDGVLAWVDSIITSENPYRVVMTTHAYLYGHLTDIGVENITDFDEANAPFDGERIPDTGYEYSPPSDLTDYNSGVGMWDNLISTNDKIAMANSGHVLDIRQHSLTTPIGNNEGGIAHSVRVDTYANGNKCNQVVNNYQNDGAFGAAGLGNKRAGEIVFYEFDSSLKTIRNYTYNPAHNNSVTTLNNYPAVNPNWVARHTYNLTY